MNSKKKKEKKLTSGLLTLMLTISTMQPMVARGTVEIESTVAEEYETKTFEEETVTATIEETVTETAMPENGLEQSMTLEDDLTSEELEGHTNSNQNIFESGESDQEMELQTEIESETLEIADSEVETNSTPQVGYFMSLDPSSGLSKEDLAGIDFSSKRLIMAIDNSYIIDPEDILSTYNGVYLMQYETENQAKYAYAYYYGKSEFVDVDTVISIADGDDSANAALPMATKENPIAELQEAFVKNPIQTSGAVAIIDTGVNSTSNVIESVSMIGESTIDENGHGTKMAQLVIDQNPNVSILSIKALGADGTGDISAVYAAIQYAIDKKVSVINLSISAIGTAENAALTSIINEAVTSGIAVVGAAGNNAKDARFYVPGNIESAYIIGAADNTGARIPSSNYGSTVDFNVIANSTSEAAAKFSGYYTLNGAVEDEKLVFPTDYKKPVDPIDYNGPAIRHQISYYNYQGSEDDLVWISQKNMKTTLDNDYITTYIGFAEDADKIHNLEVFVDFMSMSSEHTITEECIVDPKTMTVKIPASYKDSDLTVRWFMPNASYSYGYEVDAKYMVSNTPKRFQIADNNVIDIDGLDLATAQGYVNGWIIGYTHTSDSMNHSYVNYSTDDIHVGDYFQIQNGYIAGVQEYPGITTTRAEVLNLFGSTAINTTGGPLNGQLFLTHFITVARESDGADVSSWFNSIGGKADGIIRADIDNKINPSTNDHDTEEVSAGLGWVFGTCANGTIGGHTPFFEPGGRIICTSKDADGTAYFFYVCKSIRAQWTGGSFSITPILPKTGYLKIQKTSTNPEISNGNSCYHFDSIKYDVFADEECINKISTLNLNIDGNSDPVELNEGIYYIREELDISGSGYYANPTIYTVQVIAGTTIDSPVILNTQDTPMNDPFGIIIDKISADGSTENDLSRAQYEINYYSKQYASVEELQADTTADQYKTTWVIQTKKGENGNYRALLDDEHIVSGNAVYGKNNTGTYVIPLGTITVEEKVAPAGFTVDGAIVKNVATDTILSGTNNLYLFNLVDANSSVYLKSSNVLNAEITDEAAITLKYSEMKNYAGIRIAKYDATTGNSAIDNASLAGIRFAIINEAGVVVSVVTTNEKGYAATGASELPIGTYTVKELRRDATINGGVLSEGSSLLANDYYQWKDNTDIVTLTDADKNTLVWAKSFYNNRVVRGDLTFVKKNAETGKTLAYIPFRITNTVTGETHYILTDADGNFTSAVGKAINTNANDAVLSEYSDQDVIPQSAIDSLTKDAGLWFRIGSEGTITNANDSYGALPYGTYTISELKTASTKSMKMYTNTFTIDTDGILLNLGTINNIPMSIRTTLVDVNEMHVTKAISSVTLTDHVSYKNLDTNHKYTLTGILYLKDENTLTKLATKIVDFTPTEKNGIQDVIFTFDASNLAGKAVVAFEELSLNGEFCAEHKDKDDENQTVTFPNIQTTITDSENGSHNTIADKEIVLIDTVRYNGLEIGRKYSVTGTLIDKETGKTILDDAGKEITASNEFTAKNPSGSIDITFKFSGINLAGKIIVAFEHMYTDGKEVAAHADLHDESQTEYFPSIYTTATSNDTEDHVVGANEKVTITDHVTLKALKIGSEYTLNGLLMNAKTGKPITIDGNTIIAKKTFTADVHEMTIPLTYELNASKLAGTTTVVFEDLYADGTLIASHSDLKDTEQTVYIPKIHTVAKDQITKINHTEATKNATIVDTVFYTNLLQGRKYTVTGILMNQVTNQPILINSKEVTASTTFTAEETEGSVDVIFTFDASAITGTTVVAFETLTYKNIEIAVHTNIEDKDQTIYIPQLGTTALGQDTKDHIEKAKEEAVIVDTVTYKSLEIGREYIITGILIDKETGKAITDAEGNTIISSTIFTAKSQDGYVDVAFTFDSSLLAGKTLVAFETLYTDEKEVSIHADLEDENQTICIPEIHTMAIDKATRNHNGIPANETTIVDEVFYKNLIPGKEYTVTGTLMIKETGAPLVINGEVVTSQKTFTAKEMNGSVSVEFTFNSSSLAGKHIVAFEDVEYEGISVGSHSDLNDEDQTIVFPIQPKNPSQPENPPVVTGDDSTPMPYWIGFISALSTFVLITVILIKRRKQI